MLEAVVADGCHDVDAFLAVGENDVDALAPLTPGIVAADVVVDRVFVYEDNVEVQLFQSEEKESSVSFLVLMVAGEDWRVADGGLKP